jgi:hypothetical protein
MLYSTLAYVNQPFCVPRFIANNIHVKNMTKRVEKIREVGVKEKCDRMKERGEVQYKRLVSVASV